MVRSHDGIGIALSLLLPGAAALAVLPAQARSQAPVVASADGANEKSSSKEENKKNSDKSDRADKETTESEAEASDGKALSEAERQRRQTLIEADELYRAGKREAAQQRYRQAKAPFASAQPAEAAKADDPYSDAAELPPGGQVYWRNYQQGQKQQLESKVLASLQLLVKKHPTFIPGHLQYAQVLAQRDRHDRAIQVLERALDRYPDRPKLVRATVESYAQAERWLQGSIVARRFALTHPDHPQADTFRDLADKQLERQQEYLRAEMRTNAIANLFTGALSYGLTGSLLGPLSAAESAALLLRGESSVGEQIAEGAREQLPMVEDEAVVNYVRDLGNEVARYTGRDEFDYQFYVVKDEHLNAFALPGGKVFVHAGALTEAESKAELAGLLAHELAHAALSHGFQRVTQGNLTANLTEFLPLGGTAANLLVLDYTRDTEREADLVGTRILAASQYAADGLYGFMKTVEAQADDRPPVWLASHPKPGDRARNIKQAIVSHGYNRYAYEGVAEHQKIQTQVEAIIEQCKQSGECGKQQEQ